MTNLESIKKSLKLDADTLARYEFSQKLEQLEASSSNINKIIIELVSMLAEAKKELASADMEIINKLIDEVNSQLINPKELTFQKLKSYCSFRGIETKEKDSKQLLAELAQI